MTDKLDKTALISCLRARAALLRDLGATGLFLFGSRARGDNHPDSDVDLFIDFDPEKKCRICLEWSELSGSWNESLT